MGKQRVVNAGQLKVALRAVSPLVRRRTLVPILSCGVPRPPYRSGEYAGGCDSAFGFLEEGLQ